jgi:hypothetical protein
MQAYPILRIAIKVGPTYDGFESASEKLQEWLNLKGSPYGQRLEPGAIDSPPDRNVEGLDRAFKLDFARADDAFCFVLEYPEEEGGCGRWKVEALLTRPVEIAWAVIDLRFSYISEILPPSSAYRSAELLRYLTNAQQVIDGRPLSCVAQSVTSERLSDFVDLLGSPERTLPLVAISDNRYFDADPATYLVDCDRLAEDLAGVAHVYRIEREQENTLRQVLGDDLAVYRGAVRCYLPQFSKDDEPSRHKYWKAKTIWGYNEYHEPGYFNDTCVQHVFAHVRRGFELTELISPELLRKTRGRVCRRLPLEDPLKVSMEWLFGESGSTIDEIAESIYDWVQGFEDAIIQLRSENARLSGDVNDWKALADSYQDDNRQLTTQLLASSVDPDSETSIALRPMWKHLRSLCDSLHEVTFKFRKMEEDTAKAGETKRQLKEASDTIHGLKASNDSILRKQVGADSQAPLLAAMIEILPQIRAGRPSLGDSLKLIALMFPARVTVLDAAFKSAKRSSYRYPDRGYDLLWKLATEYWEKMTTVGDVRARDVFGTSYASGESGNLSNEGRSAREFQFGEFKLQMNQHLKLGTSESPAETLRIHFCWLGDDKRIVIGHCGEHLPL